MYQGTRSPGGTSTRLATSYGIRPARMNRPLSVSPAWGSESSKANTARLAAMSATVTTGKRRVGLSSWSGIKRRQALTLQAQTLSSGIFASGSRAVLVSRFAGDSQKWNGTNTVP